MTMLVLMIMAIGAVTVVGISLIIVTILIAKDKI